MQALICVCVVPQRRCAPVTPISMVVGPPKLAAHVQKERGSGAFVLTALRRQSPNLYGLWSSRRQNARPRRRKRDIHNYKLLEG